MTRQQVYGQQQVYGKSYGGTPAENYQRFLWPVAVSLML